MRSIVTALCLAATAVAAAACRPPPVTDKQLAWDSLPCPPRSESVATDDTLDARALTNEKVEDAAEVARRYGCRLRITIRDGYRQQTGTPRTASQTPKSVGDAFPSRRRVCRRLGGGTIDNVLCGREYVVPSDRLLPSHSREFRLFDLRDRQHPY